MKCTGDVGYLPTNSSSLSEARGRCFFQMSMVKSVELLLKMEVRDDIRAAIITAIMSPLKPAVQTDTQIWRDVCWEKLKVTEIFRNEHRGEKNSPLGMSSMTSLGKAMLEHPTSAPHTRTHSSGSTHPTVSEKQRIVEYCHKQSGKQNLFLFPPSRKLLRCHGQRHWQ